MRDSHRKSVTVWTLATCVIALGLAPVTPESQNEPDILQSASVQSVGIEQGQTILTLRYRSNATEQVALVGPTVPAAYRSLVTPVWSRPCPARRDSEVTIARAEGLPVTVLERASTSGGTVDRQPCFLRLYFDLTKLAISKPESAYELRRALGTSLSIISDYKLPVHVWVRGVASDVLALYGNPAVMLDATKSKGPPALAPSIQPVADLRAKLQSRTVLARVIPFQIPLAQRPVGGGWPYFVVALYEEGRDGGVVRIVDYSGLIQ